MIQDILKVLSAWACELRDEIGSDGAYVFGSLIYRNGSQFIDASDVDLVVRLPANAKTALLRLRWLEALRSRKVALESELAALLNRDPDKPICSFVVPTKVEVDGDLHKDGSPAFFTSNQFFNLLTGAKTVGIPGAAVKPIDSTLAQMCFRFAQKERNLFLDVCASGATKFVGFDGSDPMPKGIMRHAAMAAELSKPGAEAGSQFDIQFGLDFVSNGLYQIQKTDGYLQDLHDRLSIRRGGRGTKGSLTPGDQVFLAEWIFDQALEALIAKEKTSANALPKLNEHSTVFFAQRFSAAFPGVRDIAWFEEPADIKARLEILLEQPLRFENASPIWWWRDGNLQIDSFCYLGDGIFLMDSLELKIRKVAGISSLNYYHNFVYVEVEAMEPVGVYDHSDSTIADSVARSGYSLEEYGLVDGKHPISRGEYDDGSAKIDGTLQNIKGRSELRVRYLTPYNFLIAAQMSPINNTSFDQKLGEMLNAILVRKETLDELSKSVRRLPKLRY